MYISCNCHEPKIGKFFEENLHWNELSSPIVFFKSRFPEIDHLSQAKNQKIKISFTLKAVIKIKKKKKRFQRIKNINHNFETKI